MLRRLPPPFNRVLPLATCVDALADAVARRRRKVFVPGSLAPLAAIRQLFASPFAERVTRAQARRVLPDLERDVRSLGRPFGGTSVGMGRGEAER
jgi:hypothetical protein